MILAALSDLAIPVGVPLAFGAALYAIHRLLMLLPSRWLAWVRDEESRS